jgi:quercetin dioxygenase-like cupin family protein
MKYLKNIKPYEPVAMTSMITHTGNTIASKALVNNESVEIRFFSFAKGESIDKEYYEMETLFFVLEGSARILYGENDEVLAGAGEVIALESGINYGLEALTDMKLFNVLVKDHIM